MGPTPFRRPPSVPDMSAYAVVKGHFVSSGLVARTHHDAGFAETLPAQMLSRAHPDAEGLGFVRARDDAAVIVRERNDRLAAQARLKHALAGGVEIVAIDKGDRRAHAHSMRIDFAITPHTSKPESSLISMFSNAGFSACSQVRAPPE